MLQNVGNFNDTPFSFFTSTDDSFVKFEILDMKFIVGSCLQWFSYGWRRREGENINYFYSNQEITIDMDEMFSYRLFQLDEIDCLKKAQEIVKMITNTPMIKQAVIERYQTQLGGGIYQGDDAARHIHMKYERFCDYNDIGVKRLFGDVNDDFSSITDLKKCIIHEY